MAVRHHSIAGCILHDPYVAAEFDRILAALSRIVEDSKRRFLDLDTTATIARTVRG